MKKLYILLVIAIAILCTACGVVTPAAVEEPKEAPIVTNEVEASPVQEEREYIVIGAQELVDAYWENKVAFNSKYKNKWLEVTGTVGGIGDGDDSYYVTMDEGGFYKFPRNMISEIMELKMGQTVTIRGKNDRHLNFVNCSIVSTSQSDSPDYNTS